MQTLHNAVKEQLINYKKLIMDDNMAGYMTGLDSDLVSPGCTPVLELNKAKV